MRIQTLSLAVLLPLAVMACTPSPLAQCQSRADNQIEEVDEAIAEIDAALARGYVSTGPTVGVGAKVCTGGNFQVCFGSSHETGLTKVPVDVASLQAQRGKLVAERDRLLEQRAQCTVQYPA